MFVNSIAPVVVFCEAYLDTYAVPDAGVPWFRSLHLKGYKFVDYRKNFTHSFWSELSSGYQTVQNKNYYVKSEETAKKYYNENFII